MKWDDIKCENSFGSICEGPAVSKFKIDCFLTNEFLSHSYLEFTSKF